MFGCLFTSYYGSGIPVKQPKGSEMEICLQEVLRAKRRISSQPISSSALSHRELKGWDMPPSEFFWSGAMRLEFSALIKPVRCLQWECISESPTKHFYCFWNVPFACAWPIMLVQLHSFNPAPSFPHQLLPWFTNTSLITSWRYTSIFF